MTNGNFKIADDSGDRKYFTIVPNYILNHSNANAQALYLQLKRLAGENGIAYPSRDYLMQKLDLSHPTLIKYFRFLLDKNWIEYIGEETVQTNGGPQRVKAYRIVDIWKLNIDDSEGGKKETTPLDEGGKKYARKGVKNVPANKNPVKKNTITDDIASEEKEFNLEQTLTTWETGKRRSFEIIAWFIREKRLQPKSQLQLVNIAKRHVKTAQLLIDYTDQEIVEASKKAQKWPEWTLETVLKYLTK